MLAKKAVNALFVVGIVAILLAGLVRTVFFPKQINAYENRYAEKLAPFTLEGWLDGSFQDSVDAALADQVQLAQYYKKAFNLVSSRYLKAVSEPVLSRCPDRYVKYVDALMFDGYITYPYRSLPDLTEWLDDKADNYDRYFQAHPELDFYVYYIEKDTDVDFQTGTRVGASDYILDRLELPPDRLGRFEVDSFEAFRTRFYRTDHHWNLDGSYQGYTQLLELLGVEDEPLAPVGGAVELGRFSGSKATGAASGFSEPFYAYRFDFPDMEITVNGAAADYGDQDAFLDGLRDRPTYGDFYGWDNGEVIFSTGRTDREDLLVIGESYDNAVLKLLASHFDHTYAVDLRYYEAHMGEEFRFSEYVEEHGITQVLLIGNLDYFAMSEFCLEG